MADLFEKSSPKPESDLNFQVDRTPGAQFDKGQSGNPAGKQPRYRIHASRIAEALLDGEVEALTRTALAQLPHFHSTRM